MNSAGQAPAVALERLARPLQAAMLVYAQPRRLHRLAAAQDPGQVELTSGAGAGNIPGPAHPIISRPGWATKPVRSG